MPLAICGFVNCVFSDLFNYMFSLTSLILSHITITRMFVTIAISIYNIEISHTSDFLFCNPFASQDVFAPGPSFRTLDSTCHHWTPLCHIYIFGWDILQGSFRLCDWLSLRRLVSWINHLPPVCWSTFWKFTCKPQLGCRFGIMVYTIVVFFLHILTYVSIYVLISRIIICFIFIFLI